MQAIVRIALIVTLALGLAGCYRVIAIPDMATATVYGPSVPIRPLRPEQVARLSSWMKEHDAGWRNLMETTPAPITLAIVMREPNGQQTTFSLFELKDGSAAAYFYAPSPMPPLKRYLFAADVAALWEVVRN
jgi:hypothetical protein